MWDQAIDAVFTGISRSILANLDSKTIESLSILNSWECTSAVAHPDYSNVDISLFDDLETQQADSVTHIDTVEDSLEVKMDIVISVDTVHIEVCEDDVPV